jgi:hypothetical protein
MDERISQHEVDVFNLFDCYQHRWFESNEIAQRAGVADRTARFLTLRFFKLGMIKRTRFSSRFRYRWAAKTEHRSYIEQLEHARHAQVHARGADI